ncbi:MAG: DoxX family protein [Chloroflexota bacterium]
MRRTGIADARWGITVVRLMMGVILVVAGTQKWANGIGGFVGFVTQLGVPVPQVVGPIIASGEVVGGVLLLLGFGIRWVSLWFIGEFLVTSLYVKLGHGQGWDAARIDLMILAGSAMLALAGAGALALDERMARGQTRTSPAEG